MSMEKTAAKSLNVVNNTPTYTALTQTAREHNSEMC